MFYYVDESGNTGLNLFDANQPILYYGVLGCRSNLDLTARPLLDDLRRVLDVQRIHANELGVARLTQVADRITRFSKKNDLRFSLYKVVKPDHAIISFFDQVFDSGMNDAVPWIHYWTPLRYVLLFKIKSLFDEELAKEAWLVRREHNTARCAEMLRALCKKLLDRVGQLPDARSRDIVSGALKWAAAKPEEISYGVGNYDSMLQISPNLVGFQQVLAGVAKQSAAQGKKVNRITVDQQTEFNGAQAELADIYKRMRGLSQEMGPGMPKADFSNMPEVAPTFLPSDQSAGLELVDVTLWIAKRMEEHKPLSNELLTLFWAQAKRGETDEVSFFGLDRRWRHLTDLPKPKESLSPELIQLMEQQELSRLQALAKM